MFPGVRQRRRAYDLSELYDEYVSMLRRRTWRHCLVDALRTLNSLVPLRYPSRPPARHREFVTVSVWCM